jgi:hypothetical protein
LVSPAWRAGARRERRQRENRPSEQPLHEAVALRQLLDGLDHLAVDEAEVTGVLRQLGAGGEGVEEAVEATGGGRFIGVSALRSTRMP